MNATIIGEALTLLLAAVFASLWKRESDKTKDLTEKYKISLEDLTTAKFNLETTKAENKHNKDLLEDATLNLVDANQTIAELRGQPTEQPTKKGRPRKVISTSGNQDFDDETMPKVTLRELPEISTPSFTPDFEKAIQMRTRKLICPACGKNYFKPKSSVRLEGSDYKQDFICGICQEPLTLTIPAE